VTTLGTFLTILLVPAAEQALWIDVPLVGLAQYLAGPAWARDVMALALAFAAVLVLLPAASAALTDAERMLIDRRPTARCRSTWRLFTPGSALLPARST
jgi:hypothetical protein